MEVITGTREIQKLSDELKAKGKKVGLVPTMGFLHEGHLSLVRQSNQLCDVTIVSLFVNPTQFAPNEDFTEYPRDLERDKKLLAENNADFLFYPLTDEIYHDGFKTYVEVNGITEILEGKFRPTHFKGVTTIVSILFNCVKPNLAVFGQKDAQQATVIKQMVRDLKYDIDIIVSPIVREPDGLAMSSRNIYLNEKERVDALVLYESIKQGEALINSGERNKEKIVTMLKKLISNVGSSDLDYIEIVNAETFELADNLSENSEYYILIACRIGKTRLIDNIKIKL